MTDQTKRALYAAACFATIGFVVGFLYPLLADQAVPWYYPLDRYWVWEVKPKGLAMDFFGRGVIGVICAASFGALAYLGARYVRNPSDRSVDLFTAWAVTATLLAVVHFGWSLYFRQPAAAPLPDWYVPR